MQFQVTDIEFDFETDDDEFPDHQFSNITDETIGMIWEADDEDDLIEEITAATGWCIKSIDYRIVLKQNNRGRDQLTDCPPDPPKGPDRCNTTFMENNTAIRDYFTEDEWDAIFSALSDYQDYGSEEAAQSRSAQSKITKLFNN